MIFVYKFFEMGARVNACVYVSAQMASVERVEAMGDCLKIGMSISIYIYMYVCTFESQYNN